MLHCCAVEQVFYEYDFAKSARAAGVGFGTKNKKYIYN